MAQEPPTINHFIGQEQVIKRFRVAMEASWNDGTRFPHTLIIGPPGVGKTVLAHLAAKEMAVTLHERIGQSLFFPPALNALLVLAKDKDIIFIDEIHEMNVMCQTLLYKAMEERKLFVEGINGVTMALPASDFCLIAATTDEYALLPPLRDRFALVLPLSYYDVESLATITKQHAQMTGLNLSIEVATEIASRARGTPRLAIRLLENCRRYVRSKGEQEISLPYFQEAAALEGLDELGLGPDERRYLQVLADHQGKPVRIFSLEAALGIHRRSVASVIEPFLLRCGLIERTQQGRQITMSGMEHLGLISGATNAVA